MCKLCCVLTLYEWKLQVGCCFAALLIKRYIVIVWCLRVLLWMLLIFMSSSSATLSKVHQYHEGKQRVVILSKLSIAISIWFACILGTPKCERGRQHRWFWWDILVAFHRIPDIAMTMCYIERQRKTYWIYLLDRKPPTWTCARCGGRDEWQSRGAALLVLIPRSICESRITRVYAFKNLCLTADLAVASTALVPKLWVARLGITGM